MGEEPLTPPKAKRSVAFDAEISGCQAGLNKRSNLMDKEETAPALTVMNGFDAPEIVAQDVDKADAKVAEVAERADSETGNTAGAETEAKVADDDDAKADDIAETDGKDITEGEEDATDKSGTELDGLRSEVATLREKTALLAEKQELLAKIAEQTKTLLDQGGVLKNTDEPMPELKAVDAVDNDLADLPAIEDTNYLGGDDDKKEEE